MVRSNNKKTTQKKASKKATAKKTVTKKAAAKKVSQKKTAKKASKKPAKNAVLKAVAKPALPKAKAKPRIQPKPAPNLPDLDVDPGVLEFIDAINKYKRQYSRPFPSWSEVLYVLRQLGYKK